MHELSLTREIVAIVCNAAQHRRVCAVTVEIGHLSCAAPDAIAFCFQVIAKGTCAEGARLEFRRIDGDDLMVGTMEVEEAA